MGYRIVTTVDLSHVPESRRLLEDVGELIQMGNDRAEALRAVTECDAYMSGATIRVDREFLDHAPHLKLIGSPSTGTDHLDVQEIRKRGIDLIHIAQEYDLLRTFTATSELAFGLLLALIRRLPAALQDAKQGLWSRETYTGIQLYGKTLGILGLGRLGTISARIGLGFGMHVMAHDRRDVSMEGVEIVDLDRLLRESDILTVHIHLTPQNERAVNAETFARMKRGAILINTSRGRVIDEAALLHALQSGQLAGAGLDVIDGEWLSDEARFDHPLIAYARENEHLLISPHIGGATHESIIGARVFMAEKIAEYLRAHQPVAV